MAIGSRAAAASAVSHIRRGPESGEVAALADFGNLQVDRARPAFQFPGTIAVAMGQAVATAGATGPGPDFYPKFHQPFSR